MYNKRTEDDYGEEEELESETPEASNEHHDEDINLDNKMEQRLMSVNKMGHVNKCSDSKGYDEKEELMNYYRSKSQKMAKTIERDVHPKSYVSSPIEASSSTIRNQSTIPTTLQADMGTINGDHPQSEFRSKNSYSSVKKSKRAVTKTY